MKALQSSFPLQRDVRVSDREVKPHVYTALILASFVVAYQAQARETAKNGSGHRAGVYESYEDFMPARRIGQPGNREIKISKKTGGRTSSPVPKKTRDIKEKIALYKVRRGDTLTKISKQFNIPIDAIASLNHVTNENVIRAGMVLKIPANADPRRGGSAGLRGKAARPKHEGPKFKWPLPHIVEYKRDGYNGVKPIGIIITGEPGAAVLSSAAGVIKKIGRMRGFGRFVVISHPGRFATVYSNLSRIAVSEGDIIAAHNIIGTIDRADKRLHFQIDYEGKPQNPLEYLPHI
jgi:murein DD-endopeptidase MepM/ murein hydrolase activator NlpD